MSTEALVMVLVVSVGIIITLIGFGIKHGRVLGRIETQVFNHIPSQLREMKGCIDSMEKRELQIWELIRELIRDRSER